MTNCENVRMSKDEFRNFFNQRLIGYELTREAELEKQQLQKELDELKRKMGIDT